jgi:putative DNA primase/helicase
MNDAFDLIKGKLSPRFEELVKAWFPGGKMQGPNEYMARNPTKDDKHLGSFSISLDKQFGYDFATDHYYDIVGLYAVSHAVSNTEAAGYLMTLCEMTNHRKTFQCEYSQSRTQVSNRSCEPNIAPKPFDTRKMWHKHLGRPHLIHIYRNPSGSLIGYTARFLVADGSMLKKVLPMSWVTEDDGGHWRWSEKGWNGTKPIYGIEKLATYPDRPVLITEGEKTCDASQRMFPEVVCLSWRGGAASASRAQWEQLANRTVAIWPDRDEAGLRAAEHISRILPNIEVITPPKWKPSGWDLADAEE